MTFRLMSGVLKPEGDWPGIFIRGDEALGYAVSLRRVIAGLGAQRADLSTQTARACISLIELAELLESCRITD